MNTTPQDTIKTAIEFFDSEGRLNEQQVTYIVQLAEHFLSEAEPLSATNHWKAYGIVMRCAELTFEAIDRLAKAIVVRKAELPLSEFSSVFHCTLGFMGVVSTWLDLHVEDVRLNALLIYERASKALLALTRAMGAQTYTDFPEQEEVEQLRCLFAGTILLVDEVLAAKEVFPSPLYFTLESNPSLQAGSMFSSQEAQRHMKLNDPVLAYTCVSALAQFWEEYLTAVPASQWPSSDFAFRLSQAIDATLHRLLSASSSLNPHTRVRIALSLVRTLSNLRALHSVSSTAHGWNILLLRHRLASEESVGWDAMDQYLVEVLNEGKVAFTSREEIREVANAMKDNSGSASGLGVAFANYVASKVPETLLVEIQRTLLELVPDTDGAKISAVIASRLAVNDDQEMEDAERDWKARAHSALTELLFPEPVGWEHKRLSEVQCLQNTYRTATSFFDQHVNFPAEWRMGATSKLGALLDLFPPHSQGHRPMFLPLYHAYTKSMFTGNKDDSPLQVRKAAFKCTSKIIMHGGFDKSLPAEQNDFRYILHGLEDPSRSVRLAAGEALRSLIECFAQLPTQQFAILFDWIDTISDSATPSGRETLVLTIGILAESRQASIQHRALQFLILEMKRTNPFSKAQAASEIFRLSRLRAISPWRMYLPFIDDTAPCLLSLSKHYPRIIEDACSVLLIEPRQFHERTIRYTLPEIIARQDTGALEDVTDGLGIPTGRLLFTHGAAILTHLYMMDTGHMPSLEWMARRMDDAANGRGGINAQSVTRSFIADLLPRLAIKLGDADATIGKQAEFAIKRVAKVFHSVQVEGKPGRTSITPDMATFLQGHLLTIIARLNDVLSEALEKSNLATKQSALRGLGALIELVQSSSIKQHAPQIMVTLQTMINLPVTAASALDVWLKFLKKLAAEDEYVTTIYFGTTSATLAYLWPRFSDRLRGLGQLIFDYMIKIGQGHPDTLRDVVSLSGVPGLEKHARYFEKSRRGWTAAMKFQNILDRLDSPNIVVAIQSLVELKAFFSTEQEFATSLTLGDSFDPAIGQLITRLFMNAAREGDDTETLRLLAFECIGILGAVDPDRTPFPTQRASMVLLENFDDGIENEEFACHILVNLLVPAFRSTSETTYQSRLAFSIQMILKQCGFTPDLLRTDETSKASPLMRSRKKWRALEQHVKETVTPFLAGKFSYEPQASRQTQSPIYPCKSTYREWTQLWTEHLMSLVNTDSAAGAIFRPLYASVNHNDVFVAHNLLPHLVLHHLLSGVGDVVEGIRLELTTVLEDQVNLNSTSTSDKRLLSAQAVFILLDHLNRWLRLARQKRNTKHRQVERQGNSKEARRMRAELARLDKELEQIGSILAINDGLMAKAAFKSKSYARALMSFEHQAVVMQVNNSPELPALYEKMHELYSHLDEPDGMEGLSTMIPAPSLEHQTLEHQAMGRWTSAQSCWEVRLQQSPDNLDCHLGLLRCLRNLGHYDTLSTHVRGVLVRRPEWGHALARYQVESAWMMGAWDEVRIICEENEQSDPELALGRLILAIHSGDTVAIKEALSTARLILGAPIAAAGVDGYRRTYDSVLNLHLIHELADIYNFMSHPKRIGSIREGKARVTGLNKFREVLTARLEATLPTFRNREPILSMRRTAFRLSPSEYAKTETDKSWLATAKIARRSNQMQVAYSALLQAQSSGYAGAFIESAKVMKGTDSSGAVAQLRKSMQLFTLELENDRHDIAGETDAERRLMKAKAMTLLARWKCELQMSDAKDLSEEFQAAAKIAMEWESGHFYFGQFQDVCYKGLHKKDRIVLGFRRMATVIDSYANAIKCGSKFVYQTVPRFLSIWWEMNKLHADGACPNDGQKDFIKLLSQVNTAADVAFRMAPAYQWYTAFPQIVSRIGADFPDDKYEKYWQTLIVRILNEYPEQAIWLFIATLKSKDKCREKRAHNIMDIVKTSGPPNAKTYMAQCFKLTTDFLALIDFKPAPEVTRMDMEQYSPGLLKLSKNSKVIIPLIESLTIRLPASSSTRDTRYQPFPPNLPTFQEFEKDVPVMSSLARPKKISATGSNAQRYAFLGKPHDDLRKDARVMDLFNIINKLLNTNPESRKRQLHIRTYGVMPLNETCGLIQWVPKTLTVRSALNPNLLGQNEGEKWNKIEDDNDALIFFRKICAVRPVKLGSWFVETFPEPSAWLAARTAYARTLAVMSIVGYILGLGDRHCENILLDVNTGEVMHVDFNVLFDKGKTLNIAERVPFRLTRNILDGLGITGSEGPYRVACELAMDIVRNNMDPLVAVLEAFVHDPLSEFNEDKVKDIREKREAAHSRRKQEKRDQALKLAILPNRAEMSIEEIAKSVLDTVKCKLRGEYGGWTCDFQGKPKPTKELVSHLIADATNEMYLARMYSGWAAYL